MKFTLEIELHEDRIIDPNLPEELVRESLVKHIGYLCSKDARDSESEHFEVWIDVTDDGTGKYNVYSVRSIK